MKVVAVYSTKGGVGKTTTAVNLAWEAAKHFRVLLWDLDPQGATTFLLQVGAEALAHGCTGKGNDQVRFELTYATLRPRPSGDRAVARVGHPEPRGRDRLRAESRGIPVAATKEKIYSRDANLWHLSHEGGILEDPNAAPPDDLFMLTTDPAEAPDTPEDVVIGFEQGTPVSVNGASCSSRGAARGAERRSAAGTASGRIDLVEDRLVGMKSRGVYETPGGTLLYSAHSELEQLVLDRRTLAAKDIVAPRYADLVYEGRWWTTEREAYDAFVNVTQQRVTGSGHAAPLQGLGRPSSAAQSVHALYDERFVTFGEDDVYQQSDAGGFIRLFALPGRVRALKDQEMAAAPSRQP